MPKEEKKPMSKSIGFPARRTPSLESTTSQGQGGPPVTVAAAMGQKLTPEGGIPPEAYGQQLYDCCAFFIYCPTDKKIAITKGDKGNGLWCPFVVTKSAETWQNTSIGGVSFILSHGDLQSFAKMSPVPFTNPEIVHILRLQLPQVGKFVSRVTYFVKVNGSKDSWKCCQSDKRIQWCSADDVVTGNIEKLWGPEPYLFVNSANKIGNYDLQEYSLDDALLFSPRNPPKTKEEEMLTSAGFTEKDILSLYSQYITHCWPSLFMAYASFEDFMSSLGWSATDIRLLSIYRAFNYRGTGYIGFHELLLGIAAMDMATQHGGHTGELRCGYIFRYYDVNNDGFLDFHDIVRMLADMEREKNETVNDAGIEKDAKSRVEKMGLKSSDKIPFFLFLQSVGNLSFRGTSALFRSPFATVQRISTKKILLDTGSYSPSATVVAKRRLRGTCPSCRPKKYKIATHLVWIDFAGRVISPKTLMETDPKDIQFTQEDPITEALRLYARETVFNPASGPNNILDILRLFDKSIAKKNIKTKTWQQTDRNVQLNSITALCMQAEEIFKHETRCVKVTSPCFVFGDIHGNIADTLTYERNLWKTGPTVSAANYLFLGDYVDRGEHGIETVCYLMALKILAPDKYYFCRGNHEIRSIQKVFTFHKECVLKYGSRIGPQIFEAINKVFDRMPICAIVDEKIFGAHGGIPTSINKIADLMKIPTPLQEPENESPPAWEMMWNDPMNQDHFNELAEFQKVNAESTHGFLSNSKRGTAFYYSEEAVNNFLDSNGLSHILRGHEVIPLGYKFHMGGKVCTVFSSSNYCGGNNEAAVIYLDNEKYRVLRMETSGTSII